MTTHWRKVAMVVGLTMAQMEKDRRVGLDDLYFAKQVASCALKDLSSVMAIPKRLGNAR